MGNKGVYFPDDADTVRYMKHLKKLGSKRKVPLGFSAMIRAAMFEFVDRHVKLENGDLRGFKDPFLVQLDDLHKEFTTTNERRIPYWTDCLKIEGLYCEQAINYSKEMGWRLEPEVKERPYMLKVDSQALWRSKSKSET